MSLSKIKEKLRAMKNKRPKGRHSSTEVADDISDSSESSDAIDLESSSSSCFSQSLNSEVEVAVEYP